MKISGQAGEYKHAEEAGKRPSDHQNRNPFRELSDTEPEQEVTLPKSKDEMEVNVTEHIKRNADAQTKMATKKRNMAATENSISREGKGASPNAERHPIEDAELNTLVQ